MRYECIEQLTSAGISIDDAIRLRKDSMMLHRWHELECGTENGAVERDETTGKCYWYNARIGQRGGQIADRETPALKRIAKIMARYPKFTYYVQGDPRGCALYIIPKTGLFSENPSREYIEANYNRGIAVYK